MQTIESTRFIAERYAPKLPTDCVFLYQKTNRRRQLSLDGGSISYAE
jgi:hypothetical protein